MAIAVEDGTGLTNSNSYASVAEATAYYDVDRTATFWADLTDEQKEEYLQWATRILDAKVKWRGVKRTETQALAWPRTGAYDREGYAIASTVVPKPVKAALFELAKYLHTNDLTSGPDVGNLKSVKVDVVEVVYQDDTSQSTLPSIINYILTGLGRMIHGGSTFGRILRA